MYTAVKTRKGNYGKHTKHTRTGHNQNEQNWRGKIDSARTLQDLESKITERSRYFKLNSQSYWRHRTVEFRQHSGSVEFEKVKNWILFCARFVEFSKKSAVQSGEKAELKKFLNADLIGYYNNRAAKFAA